MPDDLPLPIRYTRGSDETGSKFKAESDKWFSTAETLTRFLFRQVVESGKLPDPEADQPGNQPRKVEQQQQTDKLNGNEWHRAEINLRGAHRQVPPAQIEQGETEGESETRSADSCRSSHRTRPGPYAQAHRIQRTLERVYAPPPEPPGYDDKGDLEKSMKTPIRRSPD